MTDAALGLVTLSLTAMALSTAHVVSLFCKLGLVRHLTSLTKSDTPELVLTSLKILRLTLHQSACTRAILSACSSR